MKKNILDYILVDCFIILVLLATGITLWLGRGPVRAALGDFASLGFVVLFLLLYGAYTAGALAVLRRVMPLREGEYTTGHPQFTLWKVLSVVKELGTRALTVFFPVFFWQSLYALFGARVGKEVAVGAKILDPSLTTLEDNCVLGEGVIVTSHVMSQNRFILRCVYIGKGATVGMGCILLPGVRIEAGAVLLPGSVVGQNTLIPPGETWGGVPAVKVKGPPLNTNVIAARSPPPV
ncbi:MAG: hypothetical protein IPN90_10910 [Elusimicrobia bacterium]|nr:hypothetical protein [Elusimicrobiota bacterium]